MEVLRGRRRDGDLDVVFGAELKEPFEACARMFGALSLVTVGQEHDQAAGPAPFGLGRGDELVDDDLGPLAKSPNWASQMISMLGSSSE